MADFLNYLPGLLVITGVLYLVFLRPKFEEARETLIFDNRVLGVIDGLYSTFDKFGCSRQELRNYTLEQLEKAHRLPDNQLLITYTSAKGLRYSSHTGNDDHTLFAVLCIVQFAKEQGNTELLNWCEGMLEEARRSSIVF